MILEPILVEADVEVPDQQADVEAEVGAEINPVVNTDYEALENKPSINGVVLAGNKTFEQLGEQTITNSELADIINNQYQIIFGGN